MHSIRGGRFEAMCGKCLQRSVSLPADTAEQKWAELLNLGWTLYKAKTGTREYALCPACTKDPPDVDKEAGHAHDRFRTRVALLHTWII